MVIFHSNVSLPEGIGHIFSCDGKTTSNQISLLAKIECSPDPPIFRSGSIHFGVPCHGHVGNVRWSWVDATHPSAAVYLAVNDRHLPRISMNISMHLRYFVSPQIQKSWIHFGSWKTLIWLVAWNIFYFCIYWEVHPPNWLYHMFQG